jgi:hypothetical protein
MTIKKTSRLTHMEIEYQVESAGKAIQRLEEVLRPLVCDVAPCRLWLSAYSPEAKQQLQKRIDDTAVRFPSLINELDEMLGLVLQCTGKD